METLEQNNTRANKDVLQIASLTRKRICFENVGQKEKGQVRSARLCWEVPCCSHTKTVFVIDVYNYEIVSTYLGRWIRLGSAATYCMDLLIKMDCHLELQTELKLST
jgi:hypothetical protein